MGTYVKSLKDFEKKLKIKKEGITITIAGLSGSGKSTIGEAIAKAFNLKYMSLGDVFRELANEKGMTIEEFSETRKEDIDIMLDKKSLELAMKGGIVLNGRLAAWVAGDYADVKMLVDCSLDVRTKRVAKREKKTLEQARKDLIERDNANNTRYQELYGIDATEDDVYDYIFDNSNATYNSAITKPIKFIKKFLEKKDKE